MRQFERDEAGRVTGAAVAAGGREWQRLGWSYNRADQVVESRVHRFALDGSGGGDVLTTALAYDDARGLLASVTDPLGNRTTLEWDAAGRERARTLADGTVLETRYHPTGLPRAVTERAATALPGSPAQFTSLLEYNPAGDLVRHTDPGGNVTTIERGRLGEAAAVIHPGGRLERTDASPLGRTVVRAPAGRTSVTETSDADGWFALGCGWQTVHRTERERHCPLWRFPARAPKRHYMCRRDSTPRRIRASIPSGLPPASTGASCR